MKTPVALAVALVGVLAFVARSAEETPTEAGRAQVKVVPVRAAAAAPGALRTATPSAPLESRAVLEPSSATAMTSEAPALLAPTPRTLAGKLERELGLSPLQRERVEEIFRIREVETAAIQRRVLAAGFFDPRATDPELARLREGSYRQIAMLLDAGQNRRFAEILAGNLINDHQVISLPDSLVVLE